MAWTYAFDTATPAGTDAPATLDNDARTKALALQERLNSDHYFPLTGTAVSDTDAGKHRKITAQAVLSTKPTLEAGEAALYTKTVSGASEWFWEDSAGNEHQLTSGGALNVSIAEILGLLTNDTYFTAIDEAGTGTVDLIKAGKNEADDTDVAILPDESRLATDAAPTEDTQLPNKKYVDDQVANRAIGSTVTTDSDTAALAADVVYTVGSDGEVAVYSGSLSEVALYNDDVNGSTTKRRSIRSCNPSSGNDPIVSASMIVKSGSMWKCTGSFTRLEWTPFGTGECVK